MNRQMWAAWLLVFLALAGCGDPTAQDVGAAPTATVVLADWPDVDSANNDCVVDYPRDLKDRPVAFDGTIEKVELGEYDEDAGATPARMEIRVHEVFHGDLNGFIVIRAWDVMLPDEELKGSRVLVAADRTLDLMGCGFTRPYSERDAEFWRQTFSRVPPEGCGAEVRDCDLGEPSPVAADCSRDSYEYAIYSNIDAGSYPLRVIGCNEEYMSLHVDLGVDACPPEASKQQRKECALMKRAYFEASGDAWKLLTYESETECKSVQELEPTFPTEFCRP